MSMRITEDCINCAACRDECPNEAIIGPEDTVQEDLKFMIPVVNEYFFIIPSLCNECRGIFKFPPCILICPMNSITKQMNLKI